MGLVAPLCGAVGGSLAQTPSQAYVDDYHRRFVPGIPLMDRETLDTAAWAQVDCVLTNDPGSGPFGDGAMQVADDGVHNDGYASQVCLAPNQAYRVLPWQEGDGTANPRLYCGATLLESGAPAMVWATFDLVFVATATDLRLAGHGFAGGHTVEWSDITILIP